MAREAEVGSVLLKNVRASFAQGLFRASAFEEGGVKKFSCSFLIDRSTAAGKQMMQACDAAIKAAIDKRYAGKKSPSLANMKNDCYIDGDSKDYDGWAGQQVVSAKNEKRVPVFDTDKTPLTEEDGKPYSGCYVDAIVQFYVPKDEKYKNRICCSLQGVRFRKDGDAFGAAPLSADAFGDDDDEEDLM